MPACRERAMRKATVLVIMVLSIFGCSSGPSLDVAKARWKETIDPEDLVEIVDFQKVDGRFEKNIGGESYFFHFKGQASCKKECGMLISRDWDPKKLIISEFRSKAREAQRPNHPYSSYIEWATSLGASDVILRFSGVGGFKKYESGWRLNSAPDIKIEGVSK